MYEKINNFDGAYRYRATDVTANKTNLEGNILPIL